jgi:hypothetical protein
MIGGAPGHHGEQGRSPLQIASLGAVDRKSGAGQGMHGKSAARR